MTKKLPPEKKKKRGRPSLYNPDFHPKKAGELALMGKKSDEIAKALGITEVTLNQWRKQYPDFSLSIKENKDIVDAGVVKSLLKRAKGYKYTEKKEINSEKDGKRTETTIKLIVPDVTAQIFWLKNRQPKEWRDKQEIEHTGKDGTPLHPKQMSDEEIIALIRKERASK